MRHNDLEGIERVPLDLKSRFDILKLRASVDGKLVGPRPRRKLVVLIKQGEATCRQGFSRFRPTTCWLGVLDAHRYGVASGLVAYFERDFRLGVRFVNGKRDF